MSPIDVILELLPEHIAEPIRVEYAVRQLGGAPSNILPCDENKMFCFHVSRPYTKKVCLDGRISRIYYQRIRLNIGGVHHHMVEIDMITAQKTKRLIAALGFKYTNDMREQCN